MKKRPSKGRGAAGSNIDIGISAQNRAAIAEGLSRLLADTYTLYLTTHNFHWNVTGPMFNSLHAMFMTQYTELWNAVDPIAERIRALGHAAPGSYAEFGKLSSLPDAPASPPKAMKMVRILVEGHEAVARTARNLLPIVEAARDHEAVLHVALEHPRVGRLDVVHRDRLDLGHDAVLGAEVEHLLRFADAADERARDAAPLEDQVERLQGRVRILGCTDQRQVAVTLQQREQRIERVRGGDRVDDEVQFAAEALHLRRVGGDAHLVGTEAQRVGGLGRRSREQHHPRSHRFR
jgi:starvation-inducible DNA-binding protein